MNSKIKSVCYQALSVVLLCSVASQVVVEFESELAWLIVKGRRDDGSIDLDEARSFIYCKHFSTPFHHCVLQCKIGSKLRHFGYIVLSQEVECIIAYKMF